MELVAIADEDQRPVGVDAVGEGEDAPSIETELDPEALKSLRSLGYVR